MTKFSLFESIARNARAVLALPGVQRSALPSPAQLEENPDHPFDSRNIHPDFPKKVRKLFDDGHYAEATFEACKFLDHFVGINAPNTRSGERRMMDAFNESSPLIQLTPLLSDSEKDEQRGYKFLFAGTMIAIRNPRGHEHSVSDGPETCLDHLSIISSLLRKLNLAGYK